MNVEFTIVGIKYQDQDAILSLGTLNPVYRKHNQTLIKDHPNETIYKYSFRDIRNKESFLKREFDNPADPDAISVWVSGVKIGYIASEDIAAVAALSPLSTNVYLYGGEQKIVLGDTVVYQDKPISGKVVFEVASAPTKAKKSTYTYMDAPKTKSKTTLLLIWLFLGLLGGHRFYLKQYGMGILYFFTVGLFGIGWIVDLFKILKYPKEFM